MTIVFITWSVVVFPLVDSFWKTLQTISGQFYPELERFTSKHDCLFTRMNRQHVGENGVNWKDYAGKRGPPSINYLWKLRPINTLSFFLKNVPGFW